MPDDTVLIIGGGVGPMAGVALHARIIENTLANSDAGHLPVHHLSRSSDVTDRTEFLLGRVSENPAEGMARTVRLAISGLTSQPLGDLIDRLPGDSTGGLPGDSTGGLPGTGGPPGDCLLAVIGVPCNTFHAPAIFGRFRELLAGMATVGQLALVDMLEETIGLIRQRAPSGRTIAVMSTTGTRRSAVYDRLLVQAGFGILHVTDDEQALLHAAIYDQDWGIKATPAPSERAKLELRNLALALAEQGADAIVLGCTELPLALTESQISGIPLIDPVTALARAMIRKAAPDKLRALS
jgi:aspartate racemase